MCTDVDRNDKSRVCVPGSVSVIGRRQIEMYSRLIHTVDHIEGRLRPGLDALDAFLTHMWAVTVTGAPKTWAMQFIEDHEGAPRRWYGGAVGKIGFDGGMNTGLTLRTAHITRRGGRGPRGRDAAVRVRPGRRGAGDRAQGAGAAGDAGRGAAAAPRRWPGRPGLASPADLPGAGHAGAAGGPSGLVRAHARRLFPRAGRRGGARCAPGCPPEALDEYAPDLVVLSPGPGQPSDFGCDALLTELDARGLPAFGVCLGLQAMVEHAGGRTGPAGHARARQARPGAAAHGTGEAAGPSGGLLDGLPEEFIAAGITPCTPRRTR